MAQHQTVNRLYFILSVVVAIVMSNNTIMAQKLYNHRTHRIAFWAEAGYGRLEHAIPETQVLGGYIGSFGVGYEWKSVTPLFIHLGVEVNNLTSTTAHNTFTDIREISDGDLKPDGTPHYDQVLYTARFRNYKETHHSINLNIPILLGVRKWDYYGSIGAKLSAPLGGRYYTKTVVDTYGDYEEFIESFENMENHGYLNNLKQKGNGSITFKPTLYVMAEFGKYITPIAWKKTELKIGGFFGYALLNTGTPTPIKTLLEYTENPIYFRYNSILETAIAQKRTLLPIQMGVKITVLRQLSSPKICRCIFF